MSQSVSIDHLQMLGTFSQRLFTLTQTRHINGTPSLQLPERGSRSPDVGGGHTAPQDGRVGALPVLHLRPPEHTTGVYLIFFYILF